MMFTRLCLKTRYILQYGHIWPYIWEILGKWWFWILGPGLLELCPWPQNQSPEALHRTCFWFCSAQESKCHLKMRWHLMKIQSCTHDHCGYLRILSRFLQKRCAPKHGLESQCPFGQNFGPIHPAGRICLPNLVRHAPTVLGLRELVERQRAEPGRSARWGCVKNYNTIVTIWLVVWNMFYFPIYWE